MTELLTIDNLLFWGIIAGLLQVVGYWIYIADDKIDPNPVTWFMFAYGTGLLTILEWDKDASVPELILPAVCSVLSIYVSFRCWKKARAMNPKAWWPRDWWPEDTWERWSFISDIIITIGYVVAWVLATYAIISTDHKAIAVFVFLLLSNLSTIPSFYPILRTTYLYPEREVASPWIIWTLAYVILTFITYETQGTFWHILMLYPVINVVLHGVLAVLAGRR